MMHAIPIAAALTAVTNFGSNPGALDMYVHVPANLPANAPVVVVMHGCTQTAASMQAAGWDELADAHGFAVVYPQQRSGNNPVSCFNWAGEYGDPANLVRGQGENQSVASMVDWMIANHDADPERVYIAGFSAGAAFVPVMLATWPEKFAAASIMSGIPYRCATSVNAAYNCQQMNLHTELQKTPAEWGDLVRAANPGYTGPRPPVQIWHGATDGIVSPLNQGELVDQWTNVLGTDVMPDASETVGVITREQYRNGGTVVVETYKVAGMGHAVCVGAADEHPCGATHGSYFEDKGTCSTWIAASWFGLVEPGGFGGGGGEDDTTPPSVDIISPSDGAEVSGTVTVVVVASDDSAIDHVELSVDGAPVATDDAPPYQIAWNATAGTHALSATAIDAAGNEAIDDDTTVTVAGGGAGGDDDDDGFPSDSDLPGCGCQSGGGAGGLLLVALVALRIRRRS